MSDNANGADPITIRLNKLDLLEQVADDLAHEIKNPLHSMVINLEVLKRRITRAAEDGSPDALRYVDVLGNELERVNYRVDLLLRMIRPARASEPVPLTEVIDELRELLDLEAVRRSVRTEFDLRALSARVSVPREPARQVVLNLALAALDTLRAGDTLRVEAEAADNAAVRLRIVAVPAPEGHDGSDAPSVDPRSLLSSPRFAVASTLGEALGGDVTADVGADHVTITLSVGATP